LLLISNTFLQLIPFQSQILPLIQRLLIFLFSFLFFSFFIIGFAQNLSFLLKEIFSCPLLQSKLNNSFCSRPAAKAGNRKHSLGKMMHASDKDIVKEPSSGMTKIVAEEAFSTSSNQKSKSCGSTPTIPSQREQGWYTCFLEIVLIVSNHYNVSGLQVVGGEPLGSWFSPLNCFPVFYFGLPLLHDVLSFSFNSYLFSFKISLLSLLWSLWI